jgi:hypothetical protein
MRTAPIVKTKKTMDKYREDVREVLEAQVCHGRCAKCGETFTGNAFEVIAAQATHRWEAHGLPKTNIQRKQRDAKHAKAEAKPPEVKRRKNASKRRYTTANR